MTDQDGINASIFAASMVGIGVAALGAAFLFAPDAEERPKWQRAAAWVWVVFWAAPPLGRLWAAMVFL